MRAINALNTVVQENATFYVQGTEDLYELLAILKPLPILNVKKEQGTLTEIFLNYSLAGELQYEAQTGTLEQVFLSPFGASLVFLMRAIASVALNLLMMVAILFIIMLLTEASLSFPPLLILSLLTVLLGAYGLAFISGSLALLFKQIQQVLGLFQFVLLFLLTAPVETWKFPIQAIGWLLPMASGAGLLRDLMARDLPLHFGELAIAFGNGIAYFTLGLVIFRFCEQQVKKQGKLGSF